MFSTIQILSVALSEWEKPRKSAMGDYRNKVLRKYKPNIDNPSDTPLEKAIKSVIKDMLEVKPEIRPTIGQVVTRVTELRAREDTVARPPAPAASSSSKPPVTAGICKIYSDLQI